MIILEFTEVRKTKSTNTALEPFLSLSSKEAHPRTKINIKILSNISIFRSRPSAIRGKRQRLSRNNNRKNGRNISFIEKNYF
jgi:hypothetical protein